MCNVCEKKETPLGPRLLAFLGPERFGVEIDEHEGRGDGGWTDLIITNRYTGERIKLTATGDEGGYFHWEKA